jgi:hypothetical protein
VRRSALSLAAESARAARPPSLGRTVALSGAGVLGLWLVLALGLPLVQVRTGMVLHPPHPHTPRHLVILAVALVVCIVPAVHLARRRGVRSSGTLICVSCHEPHEPATPACPQCGGALELIDLWEWIEPGTRPAPAEVVNLMEVVSDAWGFTGLAARAVVEVNPFGNLLVEDTAGRTWWLSPDQLSCKVVAPDPEGLAVLRSMAGFRTDWRMERLVTQATAALGSPGPGKCFCLKHPGPLGGAYDRDNLATLALPELIAYAGHLAEQIKDVPDGERVEIKFVD